MLWVGWDGIIGYTDGYFGYYTRVHDEDYYYDEYAAYFFRCAAFKFCFN